LPELPRRKLPRSSLGYIGTLAASRTSVRGAVVVRRRRLVEVEQSDLISLQTLKDAIGIPYSDTARDIRLEQAIKNASAAIRTYTDRDFGTLLETETRSFLYDGSGTLEIDDCAASSITAVTVAGTTISSSQYLAQPDRRSPVHYWLLINGINGVSPAMGFTYGLDTYDFNRPVTVTVTASWGWPVVPDDVQQAAVYTAAAMAESPKPYISQQFESYSVQLPAPLVEAIPSRAKSLLDPYQRLRL